MSVYFHLLEEHTKLIVSRGYDEKSLNSPNYDGLLIKQLGIELSNAIHEAVKLNEPSSFSLEAIGIFGNNNDFLTYRFHYVFDPGCISLEIVRFEIQSGDLRKEIECNSCYELPYSKDALLLLKQDGEFKRKRLSSKKDIESQKINRNRKI